MPPRRRVKFGDVADLHGVVHESTILGVEHYLLPTPDPIRLVVQADLPDRPLGNPLSCELSGRRGLRRDHHEVSLVLDPPARTPTTRSPSRRSKSTGLYRRTAPSGRLAASWRGISPIPRAGITVLPVASIRKVNRKTREEV